MKSMTKTFTVYRLDELPANVHTAVLNRERHINVDDSWWYQPILEEWQTTLADQGYEDAKIHFSGFWSQGDGACFEARINLGVWLRCRRLLRKYHTSARACDQSEAELNIKHSGHYYHEYSVDRHISYTGNGAVDNELLDIEPLILEDTKVISKNIYRALEREYEHQTSDEAVAETIRTNESEFLADGRPVNVIDLIRQ